MKPKKINAYSIVTFSPSHLAQNNIFIHFHRNGNDQLDAVQC